MSEPLTILRKYPFFASPNHGERDFKPVIATVLHYTASGAGRGDVRYMQDPKVEKSAHFYIARDGWCCQMVALDRAAWACGVSQYEHAGILIKNLNLYTINIELDNYGLLVRGDSGRFYFEADGRMYQYNLTDYNHPVQAGGDWWEPYAEPQLAALDTLLKEIVNAGYPDRLLGHGEIAWPRGRKQDPGKAFPWERFRPAAKTT